ncbi:hypothetical protein D3C76_255180 [compost metagenome]
MKLTVFHDGQYWIGVVEEQEQGKLKAAKYIFGAEPKDEEILAFISKELRGCVSGLTQEVPTKLPEAKRVNPKRLARQVGLEVKSKGISSYAQSALQLEYEKRKLEKRIRSKQEQEEKKERIRGLKKQKAKAKHRGH